MNLQDHIEYIRNRCIDAIAHGDKMDVADWRTGEGIYMSFNEAIEIANEIDRLKAEKAELLASLKSLRGMEPWIGDSNVLEFFQKTVYTAIEKAETFNNSKQTT